ncbi:hypothetical protein [Salinifilum aidingensis]
MFFADLGKRSLIDRHQGGSVGFDIVLARLSVGGRPPRTPVPPRCAATINSIRDGAAVPEDHVAVGGRKYADLRAPLHADLGQSNINTACTGTGRSFFTTLRDAPPR